MNRRLLWCLLCCGFVAIPFLLVEFPPITDLPQHVGQIRLFHETLAQPDGPYQIQWWTPYALVYLLIGFWWQIVPPMQVGNLAAMSLLMLCVAATHWLAARLGRPREAAIMATLLLFNHLLVWGLMNFLLGWPVFVLWLIWTLTAKPGRAPWIEISIAILMSSLLYITHVLWLAFGLIWLVVRTVTDRSNRQLGLLRIGASLPAVAVSIWWLRTTVSGTSFASAIVWGEPWTRLGPVQWSEATLGALRSTLELVPFMVLIVWIVLAFARGTDRGHRGLLICGSLLLAGYLFLPEKYNNTILFHSRWMPFAAICLLLAAPRLPWERWHKIGLAALMTGFLLLTSLSWMAYDRVEMAGLEESLSALPEEPRVLGLDFHRQSRWIDGRPFFQAFAYAQVLRGGTLSFSFAEFRPSLVVFREDRTARWTNGLEWLPGEVKPSDFGFFDHVLIHGSSEIQEEAKSLGPITPMNETLPWRLHRVRDSGSTP